VESGADWQPYGELWLSDAKTNEKATLEYRVKFSDEEWK